MLNVPVAVGDAVVSVGAAVVVVVCALIVAGTPATASAKALTHRKVRIRSPVTN
jgi:hypothetical protein